MMHGHEEAEEVVRGRLKHRARVRHEYLPLPAWAQSKGEPQWTAIHEGDSLMVNGVGLRVLEVGHGYTSYRVTVRDANFPGCEVAR
jgi:riboflavin synthase alpha subunit